MAKSEFEHCKKSILLAILVLSAIQNSKGKEMNKHFCVWGKTVLRTTCSNGILVNKSTNYNQFLKRPLYYENYW